MLSMTLKNKGAIHADRGAVLSVRPAYLSPMESKTMSREANPRSHYPTNMGYTSYVYTRYGFKVVTDAAANALAQSRP